jgi:hypothetical protein
VKAVDSPAARASEANAVVVGCIVSFYRCSRILFHMTNHAFAHACLFYKHNI